MHKNRKIPIEWSAATEEGGKKYEINGHCMGEHNMNIRILNRILLAYSYVKTITVIMW